MLKEMWKPSLILLNHSLSWVMKLSTCEIKYKYRMQIVNITENKQTNNNKLRFP